MNTRNCSLNDIWKRYESDSGLQPARLRLSIKHQCCRGSFQSSHQKNIRFDCKSTLSELKVWVEYCNPDGAVQDPFLVRVIVLSCWPQYLIVTYFLWNLISRKWNRHISRGFDFAIWTNFCANRQNTERRKSQSKLLLKWRPSSGLRRKSTHCRLTWTTMEKGEEDDLVKRGEGL